MLSDPVAFSYQDLDFLDPFLGECLDEGVATREVITGDFDADYMTRHLSQATLLEP